MLYITEINGFFVTAVITQSSIASPLLFEKVYVGKQAFVGEIIAVNHFVYTIELYEKPVGLVVGDTIKLSGNTFLAHLQPGILGTILNGIQKPLGKLTESTTSFAHNAIYLNEDKKYDFIPIVQVGETVFSGQKIGYIDEPNTIKHWVTIPFLISQNTNVSYTIQSIEAGSYNINEVLGKVVNEYNKVSELTIKQYWPIKTSKPIHTRLQPKNLLQTGIRFIDGFFPIMQGSSVAITESSQLQKVYIQTKFLASFNSDVLVYVACNKSTAELAQIIHNLQKHKSLAKKTVLIITQLTDSIATSKNAIYTGVTIAEYYRDMGYNVVLVIDTNLDLPEIDNATQQCTGLVETYANKETASITTININQKRALKNVEVSLVINQSIYSQNYYPCIDEQISFSFFHSQYKRLLPKMIENGESYIQALKQAQYILAEENTLHNVLNTENGKVLSHKNKLVIEIAALIREGFFQQDCSTSVDAYCQLTKMAAILIAIIRVYNEMEELINQKPNEEYLVEHIFTTEHKKILSHLKYHEKNSEIKADEEMLLAAIVL